MSELKTEMTKIHKAFQGLYTSNSDILNELDDLKERITKLEDALIHLSEYFKHIESFEKEIFKNFKKDYKPPSFPGSSFGL